MTLPKKCIQCFKIGLRYCRFWATNEVCDEYDRAEEVRERDAKIRRLL